MVKTMQEVMRAMAVCLDTKDLSCRERVIFWAMAIADAKNDKDLEEVLDDAILAFRDYIHIWKGTYLREGDTGKRLTLAEYLGY